MMRPIAAHRPLTVRSEAFRSSALAPVATETEPAVSSASDEPQLSEVEKAELIKIASLSSKEWQARRKLHIKARRGANPFTVIVKFVMGFDTHSDASMVQADINKSIRDFVKAAAAKAPIKGALDFRANSANDDFVVLIGRQNGDKIEVISDVSVRASDFENIIARIEDEAFLPADKSSQLVHRALSLGHIVEHGRLTSETVDGTKAGVKRQTERVMTLRPDAKGAAQLVLSAKYGDASAVVHVTPKAHVVDLGEVDGVFVLNYAQCMELDKKLNDRYQRRFISVQADAEPVIDTEQYEHCKLTWSASYCQQVDPDDKAGQCFG